MKKIIAIILFLSLVFNLPVLALTSNSHSTDLETDSNQTWSIADASQTGLDLSATSTIAFWANFETLGSSQVQGLISKWNATGNQRGWEWLWYGGGGGSAFFQLNISANGSTQACNVDENWAPSVSTWYHIAIVKSGTSISHYIDGTQQGTTQTCTGGDTIFDNTAAFQVGERNSAGGSEYDGLIDDLRVWSRALSSTEITDLEATPCTFDDGLSLQGQWLFDDDAGVEQT